MDLSQHFAADAKEKLLETYYRIQSISAFFKQKDLESVFTESAQQLLHRERIPSPLAAAYLSRNHRYFDSSLESIIAFISCGISPFLANNYDSRFEAMEVILFAAQAISPEFANMYHNVFSGADVINFIEHDISFSEANNAVRINKHSCSSSNDFYRDGLCGCGDQLILLNGKQITQLKEANVSLSDAISFFSYLTEKQRHSVLATFDSGIISMISSYAKSITDSLDSSEGGMSYRMFLMAERYSDFFSSSMINNALQYRMNMDQSRLSHDEISLGKYFVTKDYNLFAFRSADIAELLPDADCFQSLTEYLTLQEINMISNISASDILSVYKRGISPAEIAGALEMVISVFGSSHTLLAVDSLKKEFEKQPQYSNVGVSLEDLAWIITRNITQEELSNYKNCNYTFQIVSNYPDHLFGNTKQTIPFAKKNFSFWLPRWLIERALPVDNLSPALINGEEESISLFLREINFAEHGLDLLENKLGLFIHQRDENKDNIRIAAASFCRDYGSYTKVPLEYRAVSTGCNSFIVLLNAKELSMICKYSDDRALFHEAKLLHNLRESRKGVACKNVINMISHSDISNHLKSGNSKNDFSLGLPKECLHLEYVQGDTLDVVITNLRLLDKNLPTKIIRKYAAGVLHGLYELFEADITHRDLHPNNVLIEAKTNRPIIVDLGIAMLQADDYPTDPKECRRYGGFDDIFSYGLLLYKMATGRHLLIDYAMQMDKQKRKESIVYKQYESRYSTQGNANWINQNKFKILCEDGTVQQEYTAFIVENLRKNRFERFTDILTRSIGVIAYLNQQLEQQYQVTMEELKNGRKIPYTIVKPIKQQLFGELESLLSKVR
ncbi:protein kinase family protein [Candidatus Woesearchaeota archaeon]|nr:protein kinase family protein [Candidatus Woesearchaeota archaeon]